MGKLSRKMARAFDLWDSQTPFLGYTTEEAERPVTRKELGTFALAVRQALIDLAVGIEKLAPDKLAGEPVPPTDE